MRLLIGLGLLFLTHVLALQANLAGVVDWHKALVGTPLLTPTPPKYIDDRLLLVTKKNVFASLNGTSGEIVWRHQLEENDPVISFHAGDNVALLLSGPSASTARLFSLSTGHLIWERALLQPRNATLSNPSHLGTDASILDDVYVLSGGSQISRLSLASGEVVWTWEDASSTVLYKQLLVSITLHVLALTSGFATPTLSYLSIDLATGSPTPLTHIPSSVDEPSQAHLVGSPTRAVWLEKGRIRYTPLSKVNTVSLPKSYRAIVDVGVRSKGYVLGQREDGGVDIVNGKVLTEFEASDDTSDKSPSVYSAASQPGGVLFNRVYWSFALNRAVAQTVSISSGAITSGFTFAFDTISHGVILHAAITPVDKKQLPSLVLTTSSGAVQLLRNEGVAWTREESLADVIAVRFIDLGEPEVEEVRELLAEEGFVGRVIRHVLEIKTLPSYLFRFAKRFTTASYSKTITAEPLSLSRLHRDQFGFQKLVVAVTTGGKLSAIDSANGNIVWSRNLGRTTSSGPELQVYDMWLVRETGEKNPTLAVIAVRGDETIGFHIDGLTGNAGELEDGLPKGKTILAGRPFAAFILPLENCGTNNKVIAVADAESIIHIFPKCKKVAADLLESGFHYTTSGTGTLQGHTLSAAGPNITLETSSIWSIPLKVTSISSVPTDKVASYGRALGDKSTLYKYLNPHLIVVTTSTHLHVIDSTSGTFVYSAQVDGAKAVMVENWLVYHWLSPNGYRIASVELYEGEVVLEKSFVFPTDIKALTFTTSKFGVAAKELVYINNLDQVVSIPRRLLDPRRFTGKPTSADKEEMLIPYDPYLGADPKRIISHSYQLLGPSHLTSSPALLESTSLLFTYGLDMFLTRGLTPSGTFDILSDSFNKIQLLLTLAGLSAGIAVAKPAVQRKMLRTKWY